MSESSKNYDVKKIINVFHEIEEKLEWEGMIDYIAITPNELSIHIKNSVSMLSFDKLLKLNDIISSDAIFINEHNHQLIIANTEVHNTNFKDFNMRYLINFVKDCAEFICPCTGSQIYILDNEIKIFIDQINLIHNEYMGVYNLLNEDNLIFKVVFDMQRPYLSLMTWEDISNE